MNFDELNQIIDKFNNSELRELEITEGQFQLKLSKNKEQQISSRSIQNEKTSKHSISEEDNKITQIKSPMVGTVYLQPEPGKQRYVRLDSEVKIGDVVCIIEAMKMMTEVKSNVNGVISKILVEDEDLVEFDQPLFEIKEK